MSQGQANALLGYPPDARLLIINADDFGVYHAVNAGILEAFTHGLVRSTTLMVPCPWARHAMRLLREHPEMAFGIHLTIIAEFPDYRWGPISLRDRVPSLLDESGCFYVNDRQAEMLDRAKLDEIEIEFRAQIEAVLTTNLHPTHLDWHCLYDGGRPDIFPLTFHLAREYGLALRVFEPSLAHDLQRQGFPANDHEVVDSTRLATEGKPALLAQMLRDLPPGLTEWAVHPALPTPEARAIDAWWAKRAADLAFLISPEAKETVESEGIILLDYRALQERWKSPTPG